MRPDEIASALRRAVRERAIPPGHAMNQDELARQYGVSRIPLREALRTLAGEGLVIMKPGLGAVVTELRPEEVEELYGLRLRLEPPLAGDIIDHVGRRDIDDIDALVQTMIALAPSQLEEWSSANYRFHRRIYELSEQRHAVRLVVQVLNLVEPYVRMHAHVLGSRRGIEQRRVATVDALRAGDAALLHNAIEASILAGRAELVASMTGAAADSTL
ncbi:GntR family transcriptional regulator [Nocardioides panaciterrulae]|uniref:DNA-binding GntR family transcriptional regulator n=1 Tax=Nocardioides panaciterrulae TaxID=661492 RepID=A0A7Y9E5Y9_9ACTN|nr:GntR family transcriptional regulator [Nocardioides panaciterrulae]NYD41833.1 DNA-binding GntR family transcriptional regulator [Nocardioides panaciterrulae]